MKPGEPETLPAPPESFTCPKCGATSHNPNDVREGYCGRCHDWTREPDANPEWGIGPASALPLLSALTGGKGFT